MTVYTNKLRSGRNIRRENSPYHFFNQATNVVHPDIDISSFIYLTYDEHGVVVEATLQHFNQPPVILDLEPILAEMEKIWAEYLVGGYIRNQLEDFEHRDLMFHHEVYEAIKRIEDALGLAPSNLTLKGNAIIEEHQEPQYTVGVSTNHIGGFIIRNSHSVAQPALEATELPYSINDPFSINLGPEFVMPANDPPVVGVLNNTSPFTVCVGDVEVLAWETYDIPYVEPFQALQVERKIEE